MQHTGYICVSSATQWSSQLYFWINLKLHLSRNRFRVFEKPNLISSIPKKKYNNYVSHLFYISIVFLFILHHY